MTLQSSGTPSSMCACTWRWSDLFFVSKLFEYTADDKLSKPVWRAKIVPRL